MRSAVPLAVLVASGLLAAGCGGGWRDIAVGTNSGLACAIDSKGEITCWGSYELDIDPDPAYRYESLTVDEYEMCALTEEGIAHCWGRSTPEESARFEYLTAIGQGVLAIQECGLLYYWGGSQDYVHDQIPAGDYIHVSGYSMSMDSTSYACAVNTDGDIRCFETEPEDGTYMLSLEIPDGTYKEVHTTWSAIYGLLEDGSLACAGAPDDCIMPRHDRFEQVVSGFNSICGRTDVGEVECWGDNWLGDAIRDDIEGLVFKDISVGYRLCGVLEDDTLACFGCPDCCPDSCHQDYPMCKLCFEEPGSS